MRKRIKSNYAKEKLIRKRKAVDAQKMIFKGNVHILHNAGTGNKKKYPKRWIKKLHSVQSVLILLAAFGSYYYIDQTIVSFGCCLLFIVLMAVLYNLLRVYFFNGDFGEYWSDVVPGCCILYPFVLLHMLFFAVGNNCKEETYICPVTGTTRPYRFGEEKLAVDFHGKTTSIPYYYKKRKFKGDPKDYNARLGLKKVFPGYYIIETIQLIKRDENNAGDKGKQRGNTYRTY